MGRSNRVWFFNGNVFDETRGGQSNHSTAEPIEINRNQSNDSVFDCPNQSNRNRNLLDLIALNYSIDSINSITSIMVQSV